MAAIKWLKVRSALLVTTSVVLLLGAVGLIKAQDKASKEQTLIEAEKLAGSSNPLKVSSINSLNTAQLELKEAIALLETIPPNAGSVYRQAQNDLTEYRTRLALVEKRLKVEEAALTHLEQAKSLANQAVVLGKKPPHTVAVWQAAQAKWGRANQLLKQIPETALVSAEARQKQSTYTTNYVIVSERLKAEKAALATLNSAQRLAKQANELGTSASSSVPNLQKAQAKWQEAINIARKIPTGTSVYAKAQENLASYNENARNVSFFQSLLRDQQRQLKLSAFESAWVNLGSQRQEELRALKVQARGSRPKFVMSCAASYRGRQATTAASLDNFSKDFCNYIWTDFKA